MNPGKQYILKFLLFLFYFCIFPTFFKEISLYIFLKMRQFAVRVFRFEGKASLQCLEKKVYYREKDTISYTFCNEKYLLWPILFAI